jgi:hypothetical protein
LRIKYCRIDREGADTFLGAGVLDRSIEGDLNSDQNLRLLRPILNLIRKQGAVKYRMVKSWYHKNL